MSADRDALLARIRRAVAEGNRAGEAAPLPERGSLGYQGDGGDPVGTFRREAEAAGARVHVVPDPSAARDAVLTLVAAAGARRVLLGTGPVLDRLGLAGELSSRGLEVIAAGKGDRERYFAADVAVSGVEGLVAETGSLVVETSPGSPRSLSLLPPVHVAVAGRSQVVPDLFDLIEGRTELPSCLALVTGPSKTGDIELRLVTGVHGPGELHVVLVEHETADERG
jgi:L-lactate dehydrogenase complex protein LldG